MKRNFAIMALLAAVVSFMLWSAASCSKQGRGNSAAGNAGKSKGKPAPDFTLSDLRTGKPVQLADFKGKGILLNFWATWCAPCKTEIPWFVDLQKQYGPQGLQILGVAMDDSSPEAIVKFANDMGINYPVLKGSEHVADEYGGVEAMPTSVYIGRDGAIVKRAMGLISHHEVEENIQAALNQGEASSNPQAGSNPAGEH